MPSEIEEGDLFEEEPAGEKNSAHHARGAEFAPDRNLQ
jgi:hypothetical protein